MTQTRTPSFRDLIAESSAESTANGCRIKSGMTQTPFVSKNLPEVPFVLELLGKRKNPLTFCYTFVILTP
jgi:hypothetical protein